MTLHFTPPPKVQHFPKPKRPVWQSKPKESR